MYRNLIFKLRFSVIRILTISWALVSCSVNSCLSSSDAPKKVGSYSYMNWIVIVIGRNWTLPLGLFRTNFTNFSYWVRSDVSLYSPYLISPTHPTHTRRDHCRLANIFDHLAVGWSLSVGAFLFLDPEMTEHRMARKSFLSRKLTVRLARFVAFLSI